jgi:hypothetical protein
MPNLSSPAAVAQRIQQLLEERREHQEALARIDQTLGRVGAALGASINGRPGRKPGRPPAAASASAISPATKGRRRQRRKFAVSGDASVLAFVKENRNPTTQEINKHWKQEGRGATADNTLSILTKQKKLKRTPLGNGIRGSRYSIA